MPLHLLHYVPRRQTRGRNLQALQLLRQDGRLLLQRIPLGRKDRQALLQRGRVSICRLAVFHIPKIRLSRAQKKACLFLPRRSI